MITGITKKDVIKKTAIILGMLILCLVSGYLISRDYRDGLTKTFWICTLLGMGVFVLRYIMDVEKLFYLFLFTIPFVNVISSSYKYALPLGSVFLIFLVLLMVRKGILIVNILNTGNGRILFIYMIFNIIIFPFSMDVGTSLMYVVTIPILVLVWDFIAGYFDSKRKIEGIFKVFNIIGLFYGILGLIILALNFQGFNLPMNLSYTKINIYDISSIFPNTNTHGMLLTFIIPCTLYLFLESRKKKFYLFSLAIMGVNLLLTFSRSSWGAVAIAGAVILIFKYRKMKYVMLCLCVIILIALPDILNFRGGTGKFSEGVFALSSRNVLWDASIRAMENKPITGYGIGNSIAALSEYSANILDRTPHNTFLRMGVEMGLFGILFYGAFIYNIIRGFLRSRKKSMLLVTIFAVLLGSLFQQFFETMLLGGISIIGGYFLVFSALLEAIIRSESRVEEKLDEDMLSCKCSQYSYPEMG